MSRTYHHGERHIRVRGVRRDATDLRRLALALIDLVQAQAEADAEAEDARRTAKPKKEQKLRRAPNGQQREAA